MENISQNIVGLENLIKKGIIYEDDFITLYLKLIKDEGFMEVFPEEARNEVKKYLEFLIVQSTGHKSVLENIINKIK